MVLHVDSNEVRQQWAERSGEFSPAYYAYYGPDGRSETLLSLLNRYVDRDASVLELGCSSGRHLAHLHEHGYSDLAGIELNEHAFDVMADSFPGLAESGTFHADAIESVVRDFDDGQFDAVYSVETLQHIHPDVEWVFAELARITDDLLVTVENEGEAAGDDVEVNYVNDDVPLYYRDWDRVFTDLGLEAVTVRSGDRDTSRAFRQP
jgi:SAM-dependent methyltransferase